MSGLVKLLAFAATGVALGYFSSQYMARGGPLTEVRTLGAWKVWPQAGSSDATPYSRLHFLSSGQLPPSHFNRLDFEASHDDEGRRLDSSCSYRLEGNRPESRWWALSLHPESGGDGDRRAQMRELPSNGAIYRPDGSLRISIDRLARPGNWLAAPSGGSFVLILHLFNDTPLTREKLLSAAPLRIIREDCS